MSNLLGSKTILFSLAGFYIFTKRNKVAMAKTILFLSCIVKNMSSIYL